MISFLKGKVISRRENSVLLEIGKIGFQVNCSPKVAERLSINKEAKLYTRLIFEREQPQLYGFLTAQELELFNVLEGIAGVGPKTALILSFFGSLEKLKKAIESGKPLTGVKGIGKKRLQRIVLELTGKIKEIEKQKGTAKKIALPEKDEALEALLALGFSKQEAKTALLEISARIRKPEDQIKEALKILGRSKTRR